MPEIEQAMRKLRLGGMAKGWRDVPYRDNEQYVSELLNLELRERDANRINRCVKTAGFPVIKTLDAFEWNRQIELPATLTWEYMETLRFLDARENLIFMGSVGTGKTHLAAALALIECLPVRQKSPFFHRRSPCEPSHGEKQQKTAQSLHGNAQKTRTDCR